jgi:ferredoxin
MSLLNYIIGRLIVKTGYIANYGYTDGSGDYYLTVDTDKCDGCGQCVDACPQDVLEVIADDYDDLVAVVREEHRKNLKYVCAPCKPVSAPRDVKCQSACPTEAISHSW